MIGALRKLFTEPDGDASIDADRSRRLAAAALLIEVARADFSQDTNEERTMAELLRDSLQLSQTDIEELMAQAAGEVEQATSLYEFTRLVNDHFDPQQKNELILNMWRVAYADSEISKYEEHIIRRVAELIYVPHEDFIRGKLAAREAAGAG